MKVLFSAAVITASLKISENDQEMPQPRITYRTRGVQWLNGRDLDLRTRGPIVLASLEALCFVIEKDTLFSA